jgi:hypothetical protein
MNKGAGHLAFNRQRPLVATPLADIRWQRRQVAYRSAATMQGSGSGLKERSGEAKEQGLDRLKVERVRRERTQVLLAEQDSESQ